METPGCIPGRYLKGSHELAALYGEPSIQKVAKAGRIRWAGHVARMPNNNPAKFVFANHPVGTRRRGAQRARWADRWSVIWRALSVTGVGELQLHTDRNVP